MDTARRDPIVLVPLPCSQQAVMLHPWLKDLCDQAKISGPLSSIYIGGLSRQPFSGGGCSKAASSARLTNSEDVLNHKSLESPGAALAIPVCGSDMVSIKGLPDPIDWLSRSPYFSVISRASCSTTFL